MRDARAIGVNENHVRCQHHGSTCQNKKKGEPLHLDNDAELPPLRNAQNVKLFYTYKSIFSKTFMRRSIKNGPNGKSAATKTPAARQKGHRCLK